MVQICISIQDAARSIGVSEKTVRSYIAQGELETSRLGRRVVIKTDSLHDLIQRCTVAPEDEPNV